MSSWGLSEFSQELSERGSLVPALASGLLSAQVISPCSGRCCQGALCHDTLIKGSQGHPQALDPPGQRAAAEHPAAATLLNS